MADVNAFANTPKNQENLPQAQEMSERVEFDAVNELREHYEAAFRLTVPELNESFSGVRQKTTANLLRPDRPFVTQPFVPGDEPGEMLRERVKEEQLTAALYRAVHGNQFTNTQLVWNLNQEERGEDPRNYRGSESVAHLNAPWYERGLNHVTKTARGIFYGVGVNNYVEDAVAERFGANPVPAQRRLFVSGRLEQPLNDLQTNNAVLFGNLAVLLGVPAVNNPAMRNALCNSALTRIRRAWELLAGPLPRDQFGLAFIRSDEFSDLMLLVDCDQRTSAEFGVATVYDHRPLRQFWNDMPNPFQNDVTAALEENSLHPLQNNSDSTALMSVLRARVYENEMTRRSANRGAAINDVRLEINNIRQTETPRVPLANEELRNQINQLITDLRGAQQGLGPSFTSLRQANAAINAIDVQLAAGPPPAERTRLNAERVTLVNNQSQTLAAHKNLETQYRTLAGNLINALNRVSTPPPAIPVLLIAASLGPAAPAPNVGPAHSTDTELLFRFLPPPAPPATPPPQVPFENDLVVNGNNFLTELDVNIPRDFLNLPGCMTPFVLMQRLMRRDYMRRKFPELPPGIFNEEANHYANIKATLVIEDVKSADRKRSKNQKAAEIVDRGLVGRGWDRLKYAVAKGQHFVGLEPINFAEISADDMLEQIINSEEEFTVFRGINKFTTTRDLRFIINKTGRTVSRETFERFSQILEEAISRFKKARPSLEKGVNRDDWDLEELVTVFKTLKISKWSRTFLDKVKSTPEPGNREHNLVRALSGSREEARRIDESIQSDVKDNPDAMWRLYLAKGELKKVLDKEQLDAANEIRAKLVEEKRSRIADMQSQMSSLAEGSPERDPLQAEIANLESSVVVAERQTNRLTNLYDRVEAAKTYIDENKLNRPWNRKQRIKYLESVGLAQVFDKMSTNYRMQRTWGYTKSTFGALWGATKWSWSKARKHVINKRRAGQAYDVSKILGGSILTGVGKTAAFVPGLIGRAIVRTSQMPKRMLGIVSRNTLRSYYTDRVAEFLKKASKIQAEQNALQEKIQGTEFGALHKRYAKYLNRLENKKRKRQERVIKYLQIANKKQVPLTSVEYYDHVSKSVVTYSPAATKA